MIAGLDGEICPAEHIINKDLMTFKFPSKALTTAVITQAFSNMVRKGVRWGYVCTGEAKHISLHTRRPLIAWEF